MGLLKKSLPATLDELCRMVHTVPQGPHSIPYAVAAVLQTDHKEDITGQRIIDNLRHAVKFNLELYADIVENKVELIDEYIKGDNSFSDDADHVVINEICNILHVEVRVLIETQGDVQVITAGVPRKGQPTRTVYLLFHMDTNHYDALTQATQEAATQTDGAEPEEESFWVKNKKALGIGGAILAGAVAGPALVVGGVALIGFGSAGIVGGSMAAGMMSASAIASGGGVAAGSAVAVMQSIGAVGLGIAGTAASSAAGAAVAGTVTGATVAIASKVGESKEEQQIDSSTQSEGTTRDVACQTETI